MGRMLSGQKLTPEAIRNAEQLIQDERWIDADGGVRSNSGESNCGEMGGQVFPVPLCGAGCDAEDHAWATTVATSESAAVTGIDEAGQSLAPR